MGELIPFPVIKKPTTTQEITSDTMSGPESNNVIDFKKRTNPSIHESSVQACFLEGTPKISVGSEVVIKVNGKKYKGIVTNQAQRDENNNVLKITYTIPFLSADDPFKFGEADFKYIIETYD